MPGTEERSDENGQRDEVPVDPDDLLDAFESAERYTLTSKEVAERFGCSLEAARRSLRALERDGRVVSQQMVGRVIWRPANGTEIQPDGIAVDQTIF